MKTAYVLAGGANLAADRLLAALAGAGEAVLRIEAAGPAWLARRRVASELRGYVPNLVVAWSAPAAALTPAPPAWALWGRPGPWPLWGRPGQAPSSAFSHCQTLLAATPAEARHRAAGGWPADRIAVVPDIVPDFSGSPPAALPVPPGARIVLSLAPLIKTSGHDVLLAAITRLPNIHAVIAGEGPEQRALLTLAAKAGIAQRTHFLSMPPDPAPLLAACDLVVCPARQDLSGNAVLQAFSARKPVVATMTQAALDLLRDGQAGILVPADSGIALAAGIEGMLATQAMAAAMAGAGRRRYEASVSAAAVVAAWRAATHALLRITPAEATEM